MCQSSRSFERSRSFKEHGGTFLYALKRYPTSLYPYTGALLEICDLFSTRFADDSRDPRFALAGDARNLAPLLLRLYEQAQDRGDRDIQRALLNTWDRMLEARVGGVSEALLGIDED